MTTQALSVAVSSQGLTKLFNALVVSGPAFANNLNSWTPPDLKIQPSTPPGGMSAYTLNLSTGTASNASATLSSVTQETANTNQFVLSFSVDITVTYQSWNEEGVNGFGNFGDPFGPSPLGPWSFTADGIILTATVEISTSAPWTFTYLASSATGDASNATFPGFSIPSGSQLSGTSCAIANTESYLESELEGIDYSTAVAAAITPILNGLSTSGQLAPGITFQWTPNTFTFPATATGFETGVTGNVLVDNAAFPAAGIGFSLPPSVIGDLNAQSVDATIIETFAQNGISLDTPSVSVVTAGQQWTITNGTTSYDVDYSNGNSPNVLATGGNTTFAIASSVNQVIQDLNAGTIDSTVKAAFTAQNIPIGKGVVSVIAPGSQWNIYTNLVNYALVATSGTSPLIVVTGGGVAIVLPESVIVDLDNSNVDSIVSAAFTDFNATLSDPTVSVTTSGQEWTITSGTNTYSLQAYDGTQTDIIVQGNTPFPISPTVMQDLDSGLLDSTMIGTFNQNGITLSSEAIVAPVVFGTQWTITDGSATYTLDNVTPTLAVTSSLQTPDLDLPSIDASTDVAFYAADYLFSALYWAYFQKGSLSQTITGGMLAQPGLLTTTQYQTSIPDLNATYPNAAMQVLIEQQAAPIVSFVQYYELPFPYIITPPVLASLADGSSPLPSAAITSLQSLVGQGQTDLTTFQNAVDTALAGLASQYGSQVVTAATTPAMATLSGQMSSTAYNTILPLCGIAYPTQTDLENACNGEPTFGSDWTNYGKDIITAATILAAQFNHAPTCTYQAQNAKNNNAWTTVFVIQINEVDVLTNFQFATSSGAQTIQCDYQILGSPTATLVSSTIADITPSTFAELWAGALGPVYGQILQTVAETGVPVPWITGYTLQQSTVTLNPGYAAVTANVVVDHPSPFLVSNAPAMESSKPKRRRPRAEVRERAARIQARR